MADSQPPPRFVILARVKTIIRTDLKLGDDIQITNEMPFFGGESDIDSLDILLLLTSVEKTFGIKIPNEAVGRQVFESVATLVNYIEAQLNGNAEPSIDDGPPADTGADALARLPHGPEFRFVTRVIAIRAAESVEAAWSVTGEEAFFAGHFPGRPIVPGVLIVESMAQAAGLVVPLQQTAGGAVDGKLVHVDIRFEQPVAPPSEIVLRCQLVRSIGELHQFTATASVGAVVVARGGLTLHCAAIAPATKGTTQPGDRP